MGEQRRHQFLRQRNLVFGRRVARSDGVWPTALADSVGRGIAGGACDVIYLDDRERDDAAALFGVAELYNGYA